MSANVTGLTCQRCDAAWPAPGCACSMLYGTGWIVHREAPPKERTMIPFIKHYAKAIVAAIGYAASIATALGLTHYHYVSVILGVLSTIAVILTRNTTPSAASPAGPAAR